MIHPLTLNWLFISLNCAGIPGVPIAQLPGGHAEYNGDDEGGCQAQAYAQRREQTFFLEISLVYHQKIKSGTQTNDQSQHK